MNARKTDHVTPLLATLRWLPFQHRIQYKILIYFFKAVYRVVSEYIAELIKPYNSGLMLRSSNKLPLKG